MSSRWVSPSLVAALALCAALPPAALAAQSTTAQITYPVDGATAADLSQPIQWTSVASAQAYVLWVGTTVGSHNVAKTPEILQTSYLASNVPVNQTLYARMWTEVGGVWRSVDSTFRAAPLTATLTTPIDGAINVSPPQAFQWTNVASAQAYVLWVGTTAGTHNVVNTPEIQATSYQPSSLLPANQTLYARTWTKVGGVWRSVDSTFTTASSTATLTSPANGATSVSPLQAFQWTSVPNAQAYVLWVGTTVGTHNVVSTPEIQATSYQSPSLLPANQALNARMWTKVGGVWRSVDSTFTTAPLTTPLTAPANGSTSVSPSQAFQWTSVPNAQAYVLWVGTTVGSHNVVNTPEIQLTSYQPASLLPGNQTLYARMWTEVGGVWRSVDSTFTTASLTATLTAPLNGATNVNPLQPIQWTSVPNAQAYYLYVGTSSGLKNLIDTREIQSTSVPASNLPAGQLVYARLWTEVGGVWRYTDSTFRLAYAHPLNVDPRTAVLTSALTQQFNASGDGSDNVMWSVDGIVGGTAASGTITTAGLYAPPASAGSHIVTGTTSDQSQSASATVYVTNYPGTFTRDVNNFRTGLNSNEIVLTPANVNAAQFGKLFSYSIDGVSDASPLYVANVNIPGRGVHNVVYVATEHDSVYAFDAEGASGDPLWQVSFINPAAGVTTIPAIDTNPYGGCCDLKPEVGITSSPVIDANSGTMFVVAATKEVVETTTNYVQRLHALDITTGAEKFGGPVAIQANVPGTGDGTAGGQVPFDALRQGQRPALLLSNGVVYMGFGGHDDVAPYHGWIMGYSATTLQQVMVYNTTPNGRAGGVWQSGDGLATDSTGRIYFVSGNGDFNADSGGGNFGDSIVVIGTDGTPLDFFTPHDQANMAVNDLDLGSGGVLLLPDQSGAHPHLAISAGKNGTIYVVDRDNMGHFNAQNDNQIVQTIVNSFPGGTYGTGNFKAPLYFNGSVYFSADKDTIKSFTLTNGLLSVLPSSQTPLIPGYPGATLSMSANGNTTGILWALQRRDLDLDDEGTVAPGVLHAFDATDLTSELYNSDQAAGAQDALDFVAKWSAPLIANGKVFVGSNGRLTGFGLLPH